MCINTKLENENWDATNSWSGYNYQGKIALFVVLKKINELISIGKVDEIEKYSIELEWLEDFSILYKDNDGVQYKTIHQVKAKDKHNITDYEDALVKLYYKIVNHKTIEYAYLHVCKSINYDENEWNDKVKELILKCSHIKALQNIIISYKSNPKKKDEVEKIGINKSRDIANEADLVIAIFDSTKELTKEDLEILNIAKNKKSIIILNKIDLETKIDENNEKIKQTSDNIIKISALNNIGIEKLYEKISELFNLNEINLDNESIITNIRHKNLISKSIEDVKKTKETINNKMPLDIIAIFIKDILSDLSNITGEEVSEDIINEIFSKFCLGK